MATKPTDDPAPPEAARPEAPVRTIADEQRERSDLMMREGIGAVMRDDRDPADLNKAVPGVGQPAPEAAEPEGWKGSTRSTPEARAAQNRAAP